MFFYREVFFLLCLLRSTVCILGDGGREWKERGRRKNCDECSKSEERYGATSLSDSHNWLDGQLAIFTYTVESH